MTHERDGSDRFFSTRTGRAILHLCFVLACALAFHLPASATLANNGAGTVQTRFVSLKSDRVNMRRGPSLTQQVAWVYVRAGLPVEIINEYGNWRQVRDSDGTTGWVFRNLLSNRRTALVLPWKSKPLRPGGASDITGRVSGGVSGKVTGAPVFRARDIAALPIGAMEAGVLVSIEACSKDWCQVTASRGETDLSGWIPKVSLWGVHDNEVFGG